MADDPLVARHGRSTAARAARRWSSLICPTSRRSGEISLIYFAGRFSHAIRKRPQPGDFRVQPEYDGIITAHAPAPDEVGGGAGAAWPPPVETLLYARVDLVRDLERRPVLMELELVEPDLYLGYDPAAPAAFAAAVIGASVAPLDAPVAELGL